MSHALTNPQLDALRKALPRLLGNLDEATFTAIRPQLQWEWVELPGGGILCREGEPSDALFVLISGRLQVSVACPDGSQSVVGEIGRGETVGEMGVLSGAPRRATVTALRDSILGRIELPAVQEILRLFPALALNLNRVIMERLQRRNTTLKPERNVTNIAVLSISPGIAPGTLLEPLVAALTAQNQTPFVLTSAMIDAAANRAGAAQVTEQDPEGHRWLIGYLDELEACHSLVFYEADPELTAWTRRCLRQADEVLLLGDAASPPQLSEAERECLAVDPPLTRVRQTFVLLHQPDAVWASGILDFIALRPYVQRHYHVRRGHRRDVARLGRFLSGNAIGLVLAGGGARGLVHVGVLRALDEAGVPIDVIGGTSIGSVLGACYACDWGWRKVYEENKREFLGNPTRDFNLLPLVSILTGRKLDRILDRSFHDHAIEELWLPFFCISSNYTRACEVVHTRGHLRQALMASMAIPGIFPPIISGNDLLVDGGIFNNMPVDVMARAGVRVIMAVDLRPEPTEPPPLGFDRVPGPWTLLLDRLKPAARRRYPLPSILSALMASSTLNSSQKMAQVSADVDLFFNPQVREFGLLDWKSYDVLVEAGYQNARQIIANNAALFGATGVTLKDSAAAP